MCDYYNRSKILALACAVTVIIAISAHIYGQTKTTTDTKEEATPVVEGEMTPRQIEHSKLYETSGRKKKLSTSPDGTTIVVNTPWPSESGGNTHAFDHYLPGMICKSDAVVVATVKSKASQLTSDGTFIFTDYELSVEDVLKNNVSSYIQPGLEITVTRPGGVVSLTGKILSVMDRSFKPLEANKSYLLFLDYLPSTGAYKSISSEGSFEISNDQLLRLTDEEPLYKLTPSFNRPNVVNEIRVHTDGCNNQGESK